jgi:hypothetical protein
MSTLIKKKPKKTICTMWPPMITFWPVLTEDDESVELEPDTIIPAPVGILALNFEKANCCDTRLMQVRNKATTSEITPVYLSKN